MNHSGKPADKPMNAFQAALYIVTIALGISNGEKRNRKLASVGAGTLLLAFLLLALVLYGAMRLFVYLVQRQLVS
ncbi:hypothetical protein C3942_20910 [Solimonas fluminis]|uniref:DUF2970 domain-containing protein n=1 Tax=Solimonas fluminis TaxID=2086571 RepID=A0A2S5TAH1_9GAMM|nr:hypothetical protein [Solimonas fluminis]PPE72003.1 hypothetical protein C3942_20910 [Solimonas fluminis]